MAAALCQLVDSSVYEPKFMVQVQSNDNRKVDWNSFEDKERKCAKPLVGPLQHVFYSVVNTGICMDKGTTSAAVGRSLIELYDKLNTDDVKYNYVDAWYKSGQHIIVLKGYDHKHLQYLLREVKYSAIDTHALHQNWNSCKQIVVLSVFGVVEDLENALDGLSLLR